MALGVIPASMTESHGGTNLVIICIGAITLMALVFWFEKHSIKPKKEWLIIQLSWVAPFILWLLISEFGIAIQHRRGPIPPLVFFYMGAFQLTQSILISTYLVARRISRA